MNRCGWVLLMLLAVVLAAPAGAAGDADLVALPDAAQALTAYDGYLVFSQSNAAGSSWRLMDWHAGVIAALPVAARSVPFDADAGPDAHGHPAVVYSRCAGEPGPGDGLGLDWTMARGCRIWQLSLLGGRPRQVTQIGARGASDSTPSIWDGAIAFARLRPSERPPIAEILEWRPGMGVRRLPGGTVPCVPATACRGGGGVPIEAWVGAMDLGADQLAFLWNMQGANVIGTSAASEMRDDPLAGTPPPRIVDDGVVGGACDGGLALDPNATTTGMGWIDVSVNCNLLPGSRGFETTAFRSFTPVGAQWERALPDTGYLVAYAQDGNQSYWMRFTPADPTNENDYSPSCAPAVGTCTLVMSSSLGLRPQRIPAMRRPSPPTE
jgi:hypothetical protein